MELPGKLIFKAIVGSQSYGTNIATSDTDYKGVYIQNEDDLLSFGYKEQIDFGKDEYYYEVRRFLQLLQSANPTVLELLYSPKECIIETSDIFNLIVENRNKFLTKKCKLSFGGYAIAQIKKAKGLDKKLNWDKERIERKTPIDFVYLYDNGKTISLESWLKIDNKKQEYCGLVGLEHFPNCFALYYDYHAHFIHIDKEVKSRIYKELFFKGIQLDDSNSIRTSSVPKGMNPQAIVCFNKDAYSIHCKDYNEYIKWLENRNTQRYVDTSKHGQQIDGKNLLHCRRLLDMAIEIATLKTLNVKRPNSDYLLKIRKGELKLEDIISKAEEDIINLDTIYFNSGLPEEVNKEFINNLLIEIRHKYKDVK